MSGSTTERRNSVRQTVRNGGELSRQHSVNISVKWFKYGRFNILCTLRELRWSQEHNEGFGNCKELIDDSKLNGCIFFGDLKARHQNWGDTKSNCSGEEMVKIMDTYSILNNSELTFISTNGSSKIDLCLIYGPIVSHYEQMSILNSSLEHRIEHRISSENLKTKKLWMEKANWKLWTNC